MKYVFLNIILVSILFGVYSIFNASNEYSSGFDRAQFEQRMYARSGGLLSEQEYKKLVGPFLNQAENELKSVQFCEKNQKCASCESYFSALLDYNVVCFLNYVQDNPTTNLHLEQRKKHLESSIKVLAIKGALHRDEVETELQKTKQLFLEGNKAFYAALPFYMKFILLLGLSQSK